MLKIPTKQSLTTKGITGVRFQDRILQVMKREKLFLRTLRYYPLLIQGPSPKVKRERFQKVFLKEKISAFSGSVKNPKTDLKYLAQMVVTLKTFRLNNRSRRHRVKRRSSPNSNPEIAKSSPTL